MRASRGFRSSFLPVARRTSGHAPARSRRRAGRRRRDARAARVGSPSGRSGGRRALPARARSPDSSTTSTSGWAYTLADGLGGLERHEATDSYATDRHTERDRRGRGRRRYHGRLGRRRRLRRRWRLGRLAGRRTSPRRRSPRGRRRLQIRAERGHESSCPPCTSGRSQFASVDISSTGTGADRSSRSRRHQPPRHAPAPRDRRPST